jgi:hypothetical protein
MGHPDYEWSRETISREAELIRTSEAVRADTFDGLARQMGFRPNLLRNAIGTLSDRKLIIRRLREAGVRYYDADLQLADAYLSEIAVSVPHLMEAAE